MNDSIRTAAGSRFLPWVLLVASIACLGTTTLAFAGRDTPVKPLTIGDKSRIEALFTGATEENQEFITTPKGKYQTVTCRRLTTLESSEAEGWGVVYCVFEDSPPPVMGRGVPALEG